MNYLLNKGEVLTIIAADQIEAIWVQKGRIWLTRYDDPRDYCLEAGARFCCGKARLLVVEALDDASMAVSMVSKDAPAGSRVTLALHCQPNG